MALDPQRRRALRHPKKTVLDIQSRSKVEDHLLEIWTFTSQENCLICSVTLLFMLEEHCYITDASITKFKNEVFNDLVVLETKNNQNY